jgi:hypothetical protein
VAGTGRRCTTACAQGARPRRRADDSAIDVAQAHAGKTSTPAPRVDTAHANGAKASGTTASAAMPPAREPHAPTPPGSRARRKARPSTTPAASSGRQGSIAHASSASRRAMTLA